MTGWTLVVAANCFALGFTLSTALAGRASWSMVPMSVTNLVCALIGAHFLGAL